MNKRLILALIGLSMSVQLVSCDSSEEKAAELEMQRMRKEIQQMKLEEQRSRERARRQENEEALWDAVGGFLLLLAQ